MAAGIVFLTHYAETVASIWRDGGSTGRSAAVIIFCQDLCWRLASEPIARFQSHLGWLFLL